VHTNNTDGTACHDGSAGTIGETCENGYCTSLGCQSAHISISSDFNGTAIAAGRYIWFNANFKPTGIGSAVTTLRFVNSTITLKVGNQNITINVPPSEIVFDPSATCATTTFNTSLQRWEARVPTSRSDEIFLSGVSYPVPYNFPGGIKPVLWTGDVVSNQANVSLSVKWSAAVYTANLSDYGAIGVKPMHTNSCGISGSDHAGTPTNERSFVVGGARGGGGSNYTGGWSGTQSVMLACRTAQTLNSDPVTTLSFVDRQTLSWDLAQNATAYDVLMGDVANMRTDGSVGGAYCWQDDVVPNQALVNFEPNPGQCLYYVVRGDAVSPAAGTYDSVGPAPVGSEGRDIKVGAAGGVDCTHP
jgi:hypothetical protein